MRAAFWLGVVLAAASWAGALLNGALFLIHGEAVSLAAFLFCSVGSAFTTYNTLSIRDMDREMREWRS